MRTTPLPGGPADSIDDLMTPIPSALPPVRRAAVMPAGFAAGAATAGIKSSGRPDLAIVKVTGAPASAAAVFTTNQVAAAYTSRFPGNSRWNA